MTQETRRGTSTSTSRTRGLGAAVAFASAVALLVSGCSGGGGSEGADAEITAALKDCEEVFGPAGVAEARSVLGDTDFQAESTAPDVVREAMLKEAKAYVPGSEDLSRSKHEPCRMSTEEEGDVRWIDARLQWSVLTLDSVSVDDKKSEWSQAADGVYVQWQEVVHGLIAVLPCRIPGAAAGQETGLPLQVSVRGEGLGADREALSGKLLTALVRDTQKRLGCEKPVAVPDSLLPR